MYRKSAGREVGAFVFSRSEQPHAT